MDKKGAPTDPKQGGQGAPADPKQKKVNYKEEFDVSNYPLQGGYVPPPPGGICPPLPGEPPRADYPPGFLYGELPPNASFNPNVDVDRLYRAMKGIGTNDSELVDILGTRTRRERVVIADLYRQKYGIELAQAIRSETSGDYRDLLLMLLKPLDVLLAELAHDAVHGAGTKDLQLIDIITQFVGPEMDMMKEAYLRLYGKPLNKDIEGDTMGSYRKVLLRCVENRRTPIGVVRDVVSAQVDAVRFYKAGEGRLGTNEEFYIDALTMYSAEYIQLMSSQYKKSYGSTIIGAIESETSGHFRDALIALASPRQFHFARRVRNAIKGVGTKDKLLIYIFAILDRPFLKATAACFATMYKEQMTSAISGDTSGNYKKLLLALMA